MRPNGNRGWFFPVFIGRAGAAAAKKVERDTIVQVALSDLSLQVVEFAREQGRFTLHIR